MQLLLYWDSHFFELCFRLQPHDFHLSDRAPQWRELYQVEREVETILALADIDLASYLTVPLEPVAPVRAQNESSTDWEARQGAHATLQMKHDLEKQSGNPQTANV